MPRIKDAWGIEVGANAIKVIHLVRNGPKIDLADYDVLDFKQILTTPDLDVDEAIRGNLGKLLSRHDLSRSTISVSVPGHMAFARFAKLPPVELKRIPDIVKFEAVQQVPFPIDQVEWDYQVFQQEGSPDVGVGIFAITKERVARLLSNYQAVGLAVHGLTLSPLAVYNALAYDMDLSDDSAGVVFMDIGTSNTDMIIVEGGRIWLRTLPIGGNNFTEALIRAFKLSFPKAEKLKREAGTSKYARQVFQAMRPVFADLVQEIQRSLGYYQSLNREASLTKLIGVGSTFRLPGLQKFLKQQLQIEVVRPDGFSRISSQPKQAADFSDHAMNLATAYGLALQGLGAERVSANILPKQMVKQRMWRAKQPILAAAAVLMVLATIASGLRLWMDKNDFESNYADIKPAVDRALAQAMRYRSEWDEIDQGGVDPLEQIENFRRILDYRDVWPKLLEDITLAATALEPQPETLEADYAQIKRIPRQERRRVYIESISAKYVVVAEMPDEEEEEDSESAPEFRGLTPDMLWGEYDPTVEESDDEETADRSKSRAEETGIQPPSFIVTIRGTTPYANGPKILSDRFIGWLKDNAERENRPYQIDTDYVANPLISAEKVRDVRVGPGGRSKSNQESLTDLDPASRLRSRAAPGRAADGLGQGFGSLMPGVDEASEPIGEPVPLIPVDPLRDEPHEDDWQFEIQWKIVLVRPELARPTEDPARQTEEPSPAEQVQGSAEASVMNNDAVANVADGKEPL